MPNLVKLFTAHGPMYIDTAQLAGRRLHLTIYTSMGNKVKDVGTTKDIRENAMYGVHRDNLYATQELADAATEAILLELYGERALSANQLRDASMAAQEISPVQCGDCGQYFDQKSSHVVGVCPSCYKSNKAEYDALAVEKETATASVNVG